MNKLLERLDGTEMGSDRVRGPLDANRNMRPAAAPRDVVNKEDMLLDAVSWLK
jgi:hypothetical protein